MLSHYHFDTNKTKQEVVRIYTWLAVDISVMGLSVYTWLNIHFLSVETFIEGLEKFILFLCTVTFLGYRIYMLHLDAEKKKLENSKLRRELEHEIKDRSA